jgi:hypothetical protein
VFTAIADPTRRALLLRLAGGERNVTELIKPFSIRSASRRSRSTCVSCAMPGWCAAASAGG